MDVESTLNNASGVDESEVEMSEISFEQEVPEGPEDAPGDSEDVEDVPEDVAVDADAVDWNPNISLRDQIAQGWFAHQKAKGGSQLARFCRRLSIKHPMHAKGEHHCHAYLPLPCLLVVAS